MVRKVSLLQVTILNFKQGTEQSFECITYEIEHSLYKFYISSTEIKYIPYYDFIVDIKHPFELLDENNNRIR